MDMLRKAFDAGFEHAVESDGICMGSYNLTKQEAFDVFVSALSEQATGEPVAVPPMPETRDRRPYDEDMYPGALEGNRDWAENNNEAVEWLADNHTAIRTALYAAPQAPAEAREVGWPMKHAKQTLEDISHGRGMFGVDPAEDLKWAMDEAARCLAALAQNGGRP